MNLQELANNYVVRNAFDSVLFPEATLDRVETERYAKTAHFEKMEQLPMAATGVVFFSIRKFTSICKTN